MLLLRVISPCKLLFQNSRANLKLSCFSFYLALLYSSPLSHRFPPTPNSHLKTPYIPPILYSWYNNLRPPPRQRILSRIVQRKCRRASIDIILKIITLKKKIIPPHKHPSYLQLIWIAWHLQLTALFPSDPLNFFSHILCVSFSRNHSWHHIHFPSFSL